MKTLYEILEVSESASKEIIEKAYKVLAKKYHPDLQPEEQKANAEKIMKQINEAYNVLIDETKRKAYDEALKQKREEQMKQNSSYYNSNYQNTQETSYNNYQNSNAQNTQYQNMQQEMQKRQEEIRKQEEISRKMQNDLRQQYEQKYQQAYEGYLKSLGYKIKYKWTWKNYRDFFITIAIIILICALLWIFPPTNKLIINFYESNSIIKATVQIIGKILQGIWNAICSIFTKSGNP